jgi:predicted aspartyl protease
MTRIKGTIKDLMPAFCIKVGEETGILNLGNDLDGTRFVVDTGFTGGVSVSDSILDLLGLDFAGFDTFRLASGEVVELPVYLGYVEVFGQKIKTWFIPGEPLLGMEFLSTVGSTLVLDFRASTVELVSK